MKKSKKITRRTLNAIRRSRLKRMLSLLDSYCGRTVVVEMEVQSLHPDRWIFVQ